MQASESPSPQKGDFAEGFRIAFIVRHEGLSGVFESMVLRPIEELRQRGHSVLLVICCPLGEFVRPSLRRLWRVRSAQISSQFGGTVWRVPTLPSRLRWSLWLESLLLTALLWWRCSRKRPVILHGRGGWATTAALKAKRVLGRRVRVLYDMRGVMFAEYEYEHGGTDGATDQVKADVNRIRAMEQRAALQSDAIICVSRTQSQYVVRELNTQASKIAVVWNQTPTDRFKQAAPLREQRRGSLNLTERFVIVYSGSVTRRQRVAEGIRLFKLLKESIPEACLLLVTQDTTRIEKLLDEERLLSDDYRLASASFTEVPGYLCAGDMGLITTGLWEPDCVANLVCCPIKFAEYLASGLPVILSEGLGDYSEVALEHDLGIVLSREFDVEDVRQRCMAYISRYLLKKQEFQDGCRSFAVQHLDSSNYAPAIENLYSRMM